MAEKIRSFQRSRTNGRSFTFRLVRGRSAPFPSDLLLYRRMPGEGDSAILQSTCDNVGERMFKTFKTKILILVFCIMGAMVVPSVYFTLREVSREMVSAEERSARNILDLAWLNIRSEYRNLLFYEEKAIEARKREIRHLMSVMFGLFDRYHDQAVSHELTMEQARKRALECSLSIRYGNNDYFFIYDMDLNAIGHPDPRIRGRNMTWHQEKSGIYNVQVTRDIVTKSPDNEGFEVVHWAKLKGQGKSSEAGEDEPAPAVARPSGDSLHEWEEVRKIIFAKLYPKWQWMVGTGVYIDDIDREVAAKRQAMLDGLRATLETMRIAKTGKVFIFDGNHELVVCPSSMEKEIRSVQPGSDREDLLRRMAAVCGGPSNSLRYSWTSGDHEEPARGNGKIAWIRYFEPLDWYIVATVSIDEIEEPAVELIEKYLLSALLILVAGIATSLILADRISSPLNYLSRIVHDLVSRGFADLQATATTLRKIGDGSRDEIRTLSRAFSEMVSALKQHISDLRETTAARERMESELRIARDIQMSMLPKDFSLFDIRKEVDLAAVVEPAREVGGDLYDFFFLEDGRLCILVGDVSGKGIPAALFMARSKALLRHTAMRGCAMAPDEILGSVNRELEEGNDMIMFLTAFLGILDVGTGEFVYSNAGHPAPLFFPASGGCRRCELPRGLALGIAREAVYSSVSIRLRPGDGLLLFTDGVTEAVDVSDSLFNEERLEQLLGGVSLSRNARNVVDMVLREVKEFSRDVPQADDITALCVRFVGGAGNKISYADLPAK